MTFDIEASWLLNLLCNFECAYCSSRAPIEHPLVGRLTPEQYLDFFDSTGKTWMIHFTGGEPFFHPDFLRLCQTLTSRHYISINSNLSSPRVRDFAANVEASRVQLIHCAVHVEQRDRRKGWRNLQSNVTALLESGFPVFASLVMTPAAFAEFPRVADLFATLGVPLIPKAIRIDSADRRGPALSPSPHYQSAARPRLYRRNPRFHRDSMFRGPDVCFHRL